MISIIMMVAILFSVTAIAADTTNLGEIKAKECESCHGHNGVGSNMAPQIAGMSAEQILAGLQKQPMISIVRNFSQQEKRAVATYFQSLSKTGEAKVVSLNNQPRNAD